MAKGKVLLTQMNAFVNYKDLLKQIENNGHLDENEDNINVICSGFIEDITNGEQSFTGVVESLENLLTSSELARHNLGIDVLARVIQGTTLELLNAAELELIAQFFCSQVKQHHAFLSTSLKGLVALSQNINLPKSSLHEITSVLFNNVVWQTQSRADRHNFYTLLQFITYYRIEDYKSTSSELLFSIISSVDGERDPRNLLLLFSFLPKLYLSISLGALVEDAFEVVSCYFPIDFHSSESSPDVVTREALMEALMPCLLAVPEFCSLCLSLIEEKLDSTHKTAKIDSYKLLVAGCEVWDKESVVSHNERLWKAIAQDTLPPRDSQIADCATQALQALVKATPQTCVTSLLSNIVHRCEVFLSNVEMSLFEPSFRLILATLEASLLACTIVSSQLLPKIVSLLQVSQETSKLLVLKKSLSFIRICMNNGLQIGYSETEGWKRLQAELVASAQVGTAEGREAAVGALSQLCPHLGPDIRTSFYPTLLSLLTTNQPPALRTACIKCLQSLATLYELEVQTNIVEHLLIKEGNEDDLALKELKFGAVCSMGIIQPCCVLLENQFVTLMSEGHASALVAISCLRAFLENENTQKNRTLINFLFSQSSILHILTTAEKSGNEVRDSAKIILILIRPQDSREQEEMVSPLLKDLLHLDNEYDKMVLLEAVVYALRPDVLVLTSCLEDLFDMVISAITSPSDNNLLVDSGLRLMAVLINKINDDKFLNKVSSQLSCLPYHRATTAHAYITKALCCRGHSKMDNWLNKLIDLLDKEEEGEEAAEGVRLLVEESDNWLSHQNHCEIRLFYRQRVFATICPRLVFSNRKVQHLKALAYLIQSVPRTVYEKCIAEIVPMLILSLDMNCEPLLLTVLNTLATLLTSDNRVVLEGQVDTFIPRFLHLARNSQYMKVRMTALQCLSNTLKCSLVLLLPHKTKVISELVACLDDKKRLVRREAAVARSKWFLLGAPT